MSNIVPDMHRTLPVMADCSHRPCCHVRTWHIESLGAVHKLRHANYANWTPIIDCHTVPPTFKSLPRWSSHAASSTHGHYWTSNIYAEGIEYHQQTDMHSRLFNPCFSAFQSCCYYYVIKYLRLAIFSMIDNRHSDFRRSRADDHLSSIVIGKLLAIPGRPLHIWRNVAYGRSVGT